MITIKAQLTLDLVEIRRYRIALVAWNAEDIGKPAAAGEAGGGDLFELLAGDGDGVGGESVPFGAADGEDVGAGTGEVDFEDVAGVAVAGSRIATDAGIAGGHYYCDALEREPILVNVSTYPVSHIRTQGKFQMQEILQAGSFRMNATRISKNWGQAVVTYFIHSLHCLFM